MTSNDVDELTRALRREFTTQDVEAEEVGPNGRYRFAVVSAQFQGMAQLDRQDKVWAVVDQVLPRQVTLDVTLIIALSPDEVGQAA